MRICDESFSLQKAVSLGKYDLPSVARMLQKRFGGLAEQIGCLGRAVFDARNGVKIPIPDLTLDRKLQSEAEALFLPRSADLECFLDLQALSGRAVDVSVHGRYRSLVAGLDWVPEGLAPMLVLDGSARVSQSYVMAEASGLPVKLLKEATLNYSRLKVGVLPCSGAKSSLKKNAEALVAGIIEIVNREPHKDWLIFYHRPESVEGVDIAALVRPFLHCERAEFVTLGGNDRASNNYRTFDRVIMAGTIFLPKAAVAARFLASGGKLGCDKATDRANLRAFEDAETDERIYQAISRSAIRMAANGICGVCEAYVPASDRSGLYGRLAGLFPGCRVYPWVSWDDSSSAPKRQNRSTRTLDYIINSLRDRPQVRVAEVMEFLKMDDVKDFRRRVLKPIKPHLAMQGVHIYSEGRKRIAGFHYADESGQQ
jgi:hypothetical protein